MRFVLIAMVILSSLLAVTVVASACPNGYAACGTRFCCPR